MDNKKAYIKKRQVTLIGVVVNILLSIIKYVIGVLSGSSALIADATHSVSDYITDMAVLVGLKLSSKPADENHPYGHGKFETFASLGVGVLLFGAAAFLIYSGITTLKALFEGQSFVKPTYYWALVAAGVSIAFKEWLYRYTIYYGKKLNSSSLIANAYHHRSDSYSSIGVMVGIVCVLISPQLAFMDPLSGIIVALLIAHMAWKISVPAFHELLDRVPDTDIISRVIQIAADTPGVMGTNQVRCRGIGNEIIVDMEILVEPTLSLYQAHDISENVKCNIYENIKIIREVIVHVEPYDSHNLYSTSERVSLVNEIHRLVCHHEEVEHINSIRFHYIPGGLEANLDIVVQPDITVKQGHDISDSLETELQTIPSIVLVHIHLEYHKKFIQ